MSENLHQNLSILVTAELVMASDVIFPGVANPREPPSFIKDSRLDEHVSIIVSITRVSTTASNTRINGNVPSYIRRANRKRQ